MSMNTTRRFPRSLSEAFPCERYPAVERYRAPRTERIYGVLLATLIGVFLAAWLCHWWAS